MTTTDRATRQTKTRYNRLAPVYDVMEAVVERAAFRRWRETLWSLVQGQEVLEVGVGTGKNIPHYPQDVRVTAIDLSDRMLSQAADRAEALERDVSLGLMDAQHLEFPDDHFDTAVATFVFCSVPEPVIGLRELARVVRPDGRVLLLEHVRLTGFWGKLMDLLDPLVVRVMGAHINRRTADNVREAGLVVETERDLLRSGLVKLIVARVPS
jgi:ubiquinone/menaquinone biosynthesis C-methylase UbiE